MGAVEFFDDALLAADDTPLITDGHQSIKRSDFHDSVLELRDALARRAMKPVAVLSDDPGTVLTTLYALIGRRPIVLVPSARASDVLQAAIPWMGAATLVADEPGFSASTGLYDALEVQTGLLHPIVTTELPGSHVTLLAQDDVVFFTSGTTGQPKPVVHNALSLFANYRVVRCLRAEVLEGIDAAAEAVEASDAMVWRETASDRPQLRYLTTLDPTTIGGISVGLQVINGRDRLVVEGRYLAHEHLQHGSVDILNTSPVGAMILRAKLRSAPPKGLTVVGLGSAPAGSDLVSSVEDVFGAPALNGYGCTEMGGAVTVTRLTDDAETRQTTVGRAVPGVQMRVLESGELVARGIATARGYVSAGGVVPLATLGGWYRTGDHVELGPGGETLAVGRITKDAIRGGRSLNLAAIGAVARGQVGVLEAVARSVPGRVLPVDDVALFIVADPNSTPDIVTIRRACADELDQYHTPRFLRRVGSIEQVPETVTRAALDLFDPMT